MEPPRKERIFRGYLSSADVERLYPARVARIARGELTYAERGRINEEASRIDREWRGGSFTASNTSISAFPNRAPAWPLSVEPAAASARAGQQPGAETDEVDRGVGATGARNAKRSSPGRDRRGC